MYPVGVLFGLGFDTSSEIALLGLASIRAAQGTSLWLILIFPVLFTAGMCLLDTLDGALMMALYTSAATGQDKVAVLYYNIVLTGLTVLVCRTSPLNTTSPARFQLKLCLCRWLSADGHLKLGRNRYRHHTSPRRRPSNPRQRTTSKRQFLVRRYSITEFMGYCWRRCLRSLCVRGCGERGIV